MPILDESPVPDRSLFTPRPAAALRAGDYLIYNEQMCYVLSAWKHVLPLFVEFDLFLMGDSRSLVAVHLPALEPVSSYQPESMS